MAKKDEIVLHKVTKSAATPRAKAIHIPPGSAVAGPSIAASRNTPLIQRTEACACGGGCPRCLVGAGSIQPKLNISEPGDPYEQEADRVADQIMRMPEPALQRQAVRVDQKSSAHAIQSKSVVTAITPLAYLQVANDGQEEAPVQQKPTRNATGLLTDVTSAINISRNSGQRLPSSVLRYFEPRFGTNFSNVRIHHDAKAAYAAQAVNARAFTQGNNIVFGSGEYSPETSSGKRLLAHELTHVVQQSSGYVEMVQRAEVDDRPAICSSLTDIEPDVDNKVNTEIRAARSAATPPLTSTRLGAFLQDVAVRLGGRTPVSPIESFIEALPARKRFIPPTSLSSTRFSGVQDVNRFYQLQTMGLARVVGSTAKIHNFCVGADKLGHFFQQGFDYAAHVDSGGTVASAESTGRHGEIGVFGLSSTGVFSNADLAANLSGLQFYTDLARDPRGLSFNIAHYIRSSWNEQTNPSFYESDVAGVVWANVLTGGWTGTFDSGGSSSTAIRTRLSATRAGRFKGSYEFTNSSGATIRGKISNGRISQTTTSVSGTDGSSSSTATPVSGVTMTFDWTQGSLSGQGIWTSRGERALQGTWGTGSSRTNGGSWNMNRS